MNFCRLSVTGGGLKYERYKDEIEARKNWICLIIFAQVTKMNNFSYGRVASSFDFDRENAVVTDALEPANGSYQRSLGHSATGILFSILAAVRTGVNTLSEWRQRSRQRRHLALLDEHLLRDVGIDRMTAREEASRRGWDI